jgi:hypothetical protein
VKLLGFQALQRLVSHHQQQQVAALLALLTGRVARGGIRGPRLTEVLLQQQQGKHRASGVCVHLQACCCLRSSSSSRVRRQIRTKQHAC